MIEKFNLGSTLFELECINNEVRLRIDYNRPDLAVDYWYACYNSPAYARDCCKKLEKRIKGADKPIEVVYKWVRRSHASRF